MMIIGPFMIFNFFDRKQTLRSYEYDFSSSVVCIGFAWRYVIVERHQKIISVSPGKKEKYMIINILSFCGVKMSLINFSFFYIIVKVHFRHLFLPC